MATNSPGLTWTEQILRQSKENLAALHLSAASVERGGVVDFTAALQMIHETKGLLEQLASSEPLSSSTLPLPHVAGAGVHSLYARGARFARTAAAAGRTGPTELQRRRAQQVWSDLQLLETTMRQRQSQAQKRACHAEQLRELVGGRDDNNSSGDASLSLRDKRNVYSDLDHLERERRSLLYTRQRIQQMQGESHAVLDALRDQGRRLAGMGNKLGDMLESVGVSNTTILQIVRRNRADAWMVYCGIVILIFLMWYIL